MLPIDDHASAWAFRDGRLNYLDIQHSAHSMQHQHHVEMLAMSAYRKHIGARLGQEEVAHWASLWPVHHRYPSTSIGILDVVDIAVDVRLLCHAIHHA